MADSTDLPVCTRHIANFPISDHPCPGILPQMFGTAGEVWRRESNRITLQRRA